MSMRHRAFRQVTAAALLLGAAIGAQAANLGFLSDTPISYMKQRDVDSIKQAVFTALDEKQDGESTNWVNEGTRNSVKIDAAITVASTSKDGERTCRDVGVVLNAKGQSMTLRPQFCKEGDGKWQLQKKR
ncbi:RT0821/Lpp0805 family surface protein [Paraburkholderia phenoliruptrix]|uniref:RT0821/Lpp0805 family surface protein n=1 Tax=Paraburkholderia phenoliruptrix TaxID=252970 RepID=UPI00048A51F1|nr:RT0821/Lpp0805 family surface protein [Paraburkholderia phenoliruptrix]MDR6419604.1 surface antigen [Paraburkholderia phenoliruptrix]WMY09269.1 RT0821/Lpp0805 family surface protein [Paraburkholderia phenoliruptrix]